MLNHAISWPRWAGVMSGYGRFRVRGLAIGAGVALSVLTLAATGAMAFELIDGLRRAEPQPDASAVRPGLSVTYYDKKVRHIDELDKWMASNKGTPGEPIALLDNDVGHGVVLTSGRDTGVGAMIEGFIDFEQAGIYELTIASNDGVRVWIGDRYLYSDPGVHADRLSEPIPVRIDEPGWYPLSISYFERKGTSTLEMYWQAPGRDKLAYVPASAFVHMVK